MEIKYIPSQAKGEKAKFKGYVTLKPSTYDERLGIAEECNVEVNEETGEISFKRGGIKALRKLASISRDFYCSVELENLEDGTKYKTFEDLAIDPDCNGIIMEVAGKVFGGIRPTGE